MFSPTKTCTAVVSQRTLLTCPLLLYQGLQGFSVGSPSEATQRLLPSTGTMPSTSPLNTHIFRPTVNKAAK
jgi:hypothetical protein